MVDDNSSTIDAIIMKSINNKKDVQENLWDLILELHQFLLDKGIQSGGRMRITEEENIISGASLGPEIDIQEHMQPIRQVLFWEDLTDQDREELQKIRADEEHVRELMELGMTRHQLFQVVRNVNGDLANRGIIRAETRIMTEHVPNNRYMFHVSIFMLLISIPRVINDMEIQYNPNRVNLILDMTQIMLSLLILLNRFRGAN
jgi:hypothetical protein